MANSDCHLFLGPEAGEKHDVTAEIKKRFIQAVYNGSPPASPNIEESSFYASDTPGAEIAAFLGNGSLFADARVIWVKNAHLLKKQDAESIAASLTPKPENTLVFFVSDELKVEKALENAIDKKNTRIFWELSEEKKPQWLRNFWRREGFGITDDAIELLLEMIENNTDALRRECTYLAIFLKNEVKNGAAPTVDAATVEKHLTHTRSESAFTLFSAIACADLTKSLEILHTLLAAQEAPPAIFAGLLWCYRKFRDYCRLAQKGQTGNSFELQKIGIRHPKAKEDYQRAYKNFGAAYAEHFIALTAEYDLLLRTEGGQLKEILMDLYIYHVMADRAA
ncbi:MAG: DNA polymerase III subunit delta [Spirochaetaceae bacterium]|jgi:DNA polymerase-3 subunit delta|nr:DNA polymerase III subunit delta [Spirochaetaceae bacterium]